ncbi:DinB family protein [Tsukamurella pseudospumae]|uniref:Methyltransferase type 12 n=1 Tax=Tsukamurella pseudospumae TaxID=239498 RepID=A0A138A0C6_9ACTN|nr:DinB family protein [Tsukamurella pseudospumae]KXO89022.1 methyltransferase type 12 [Tsukamurella pseudospumae]KXP03866.1 methyltransferase type 12 [Tsukamurella pseudospumae]
MAIEPDVKDWTWVIERACPACGFDPATVRRAEVSDRIARSANGWGDALARADAKVRPDENTWSVLEYGCHLRDVHRIMRERLGLMLSYDEAVVDGATFANWDQDATAVEDAYNDQESAVVADELARAAADFAEAYRTVADDQWHRKGLRSNGSAFTVESFATYALHDLEHHRVDVGLAPRPGD